MWDHMKLAVQHEESFAGGKHRLYKMGKGGGDWGDEMTPLMRATESTLVTADVAELYPRLAELADRRGDAPFASMLRARALDAKEAVRRQWVKRGWYSRAYVGDEQKGVGLITEEPRPIAILAGIPTAQQAELLVHNIRRFLSGIDAPHQVHGPSLIGSTLGPSAIDPDVHEIWRYPNYNQIGDNNAYEFGGVWAFLNFQIVEAFASLSGTVPHVEDYAWDEFLRNTLARHAEAFPTYWTGITTGDVYYNYYSSKPGKTGVGAGGGAGTFCDALIRLMGLEPTVTGYRITPVIPLQRASLELSSFGLTLEHGAIRGYVRPLEPGDLAMDVKVPAGAGHAVRTLVDGVAVNNIVGQGRVVFKISVQGVNEKHDWAVVAL